MTNYTKVMLLDNQKIIDTYLLLDNNMALTSWL